MKTFRHLFSALLLLCTTVTSAQYCNISCFQQEYHSSGVTTVISVSELLRHITTTRTLVIPTLSSQNSACRSEQASLQRCPCTTEMHEVMCKKSQ